MNKKRHDCVLSGLGRNELPGRKSSLLNRSEFPFNQDHLLERQQELVLGSLKTRFVRHAISRCSNSEEEVGFLL